MNKFFSFITLALGVFVTGCDSPEVRAKKYGFDSVDQMQEYKNRGYKTMAEYNETADFAVDKFYERCYSKREKYYNEMCKGKKISWRGIIKEINNKSVRIDVLLDNNMYPKNVFSVDADNTIPHSQLPKVGKIVFFDGKIGDKNFVTPDIDNFNAYSVKDDDFIEARKVALKNDLYENFEENKGNPSWLKKNFSPEIDLVCGNVIESHAKNSYRWTNGFLELKFPTLLAHKTKKGLILAYGDNIQFQNGFGAWKKIVYQCTYDAINKNVISVKLN